MKLWTEVRRHVLVDGHSKRSACREFNIHWDTLEKMLAHPQPPGYRRSKPKATKKIDRVLAILHRWLEEDRKAPPKQRHTGKRIYTRLVKEYRFDGGLTLVKDAVRAWRKVHAQTFVPLKHPPGEAQVDFGEAWFYLNGVLTKAACFEMSLPYSDAAPGCSSVRLRVSAPSRSRTGTLRASPSSVAEFTEVDTEACTATLKLAEPKVRRARLDHEQTSVYRIDRGGLWKGLPSAEPARRIVNQAMTEAQNCVEAAGEDSQYVDRARRHTEQVLQQFLTALGWEVKMVWGGDPDQHTE